MIQHLLKILTVVLFFLIFISAKFVKAETLEDLAGEINDIREQISKLQSNNIEEAIKIDKALKEIDRVMDFVDEKVAIGDINTAISTLEFVETTVTDIAKIVPDEFKSETIKAGKEFTPDQMKEISKITEGISANKTKKTKALAKSMKEIKSKGLDVQQVSQTINVIGIQTTNINIISTTAAKTVSTSTTSKGSLNKEIEDQEKYSGLLGKTPKEVELKIKQVSVIQSGDAKKHRAFEIEKYGLAAGLSKKAIQQGINAVYSGNIGLEKKVTKDILNKLSQNPDFNVGKLSSAELDSMMAENIAVEKAANAILNSGINFGAGTNDTAVDILSKQVANILSGTTDQATIDRITYKIGRTKYEVWDDSSHVAANMIAEIQGEDQVHALVSIKNDQKFGITESIAEQAARVEAHLNNDIDTFIDAQNSRIELKGLTSKEKSQLSEVYSEALSEQAKVASKAAAGAATQAKVTATATSKAVLEANQNLKEASAVTKIAKENVKIKKSELDEATSQYKELLSDQALGKATLTEVLAAQQAKSEISMEVSKLSYEAAEASRVAGQAAVEAGQARAAAKIAAKEVASSSDVSSAASEATQEVAEVAQVAAQEVKEEVKQVAQEVTQSLDEQIAELKEAKDLAFKEYYDASLAQSIDNPESYNVTIEKRQKHLDASYALMDAQSKKN